MSNHSQCDPEIRKKGQIVAIVDPISSRSLEEWVQAVAREANARVDWRYNIVTAQILHLGDEKSRQRVEDAMTKLAPDLKGRLLDEKDRQLIEDAVAKIKE